MHGIDHHTVAAISITGTCLDVLGLLHEFAHGSDVARGMAFDPGLIALRGSFQVAEELRALEQFARLRDDWFRQLPDSEEFATGLAIIEQCAGCSR